MINHEGYQKYRGILHEMVHGLREKELSSDLEGRLHELGHVMAMPARRRDELLRKGTTDSSIGEELKATGGDTNYAEFRAAAVTMETADVLFREDKDLVSEMHATSKVNLRPNLQGNWTDESVAANLEQHRKAFATGKAVKLLVETIGKRVARYEKERS